MGIYVYVCMHIRTYTYTTEARHVLALTAAVVS